jgi:Tfp pilus assembly protein PilX
LSGGLLIVLALIVLLVAGMFGVGVWRRVRYRRRVRKATGRAAAGVTRLVPGQRDGGER